MKFRFYDKRTTSVKVLNPTRQLTLLIYFIHMKAKLNKKQIRVQTVKRIQIIGIQPPAFGFLLHFAARKDCYELERLCNVYPPAQSELALKDSKMFTMTPLFVEQYGAEL